MEEIYSLNFLFLNEKISDELYEFVRNGLSTQLQTRLNELTDINEYLTVVNQYGEEQLSLLMIATLHGYDEIVRILLTYCNSPEQVELKGNVFISDELHIDGATALYCACYREHFNVAKTLIEFGHANVNQDTDDHPDYPLLIHATRNNRIDIVRFLIENNYCDVNQTKSDGHDGECAALNWASFLGYIPIMTYLIQAGADVNYYCTTVTRGYRTALELATQKGHLEAVELLFDSNAVIHFEDKSDINLLKIAVDGDHDSIIDLLLKRAIYTIEDVEYTVCSLIDMNKFSEQKDRIFSYFIYILNYRRLYDIPKTCVERSSVYNYAQECQTIGELYLIENNPHRLLIESFLMRERLFLTRKDISLLKPLHNYGDWLVSKGKYEECLDVWTHMFYCYQQLELATILHRFVWLFCKMLTVNYKISVSSFLRTCNLVFEPSQIMEKNCTIGNALFFVVIATKILEQEGITKEEQTDIYRWVERLCRQQLTTTSGKTLLHLCVDSRTSSDITYRTGETRRYLKFPDECALRLLLTCGSHWLNLNAMESSYGNTPLHIICQRKGNRHIIELLLNAGCHIDCVNKTGKIPMDSTNDDKETKDLLMKKSIPLNLKCLCAHLIVKQQMNYSTLGASTTNLYKFIDLHGGLFIQSVEK